jgi:hypothetical protein
MQRLLCPPRGKKVVKVQPQGLGVADVVASALAAAPDVPGDHAPGFGRQHRRMSRLSWASSV